MVSGRRSILRRFLADKRRGSARVTGARRARLLRSKSMSDAGIVRQIAQPLSGNSADYDSLVNSIGKARFVLLGEASHGTHEFYFERAQITKRLIAEKGFTVVAIEADWPDANRVHRNVRGASKDANADEEIGRASCRER